MVKVPAHRLVMRDPRELTLGAHFEHVDYDWRPYAERLPDARADYDRLLADIRKRGIQNPLIAHNGRVLIGMRRCEIAVMLGIEKVPVWEIEEDINWDGNPARVFALRDLYSPAPYA